MTQCPYDKSTRCLMDQPCEHCEVKAEYEYIKRQPNHDKAVQRNPGGKERGCTTPK